MKKVKAIIGVYGMCAVKKDKTIKVKGEDFFGWFIQGISKEDLKKLEPEIIEELYYNAV